MIVKILKKSTTFKAVNYNTDKVDKNKGELLLAKNFGLLQGIENLRPQDYINYLRAVSARSTRIKYPQFHVVLSTKGRQHSKEELADIAQKWMEGMGYGEQPYLLIFHKDTSNNHVHLVSTRIGTDGKKISDRFEKLRAYRILDQVMGEDEKQLLAKYLHNALSHNFSTRAQFIMLLEEQGYTLILKDSAYGINKNGSTLGQIEASKIDLRIVERQKDNARVKQIRTILEKYKSIYDTTIISQQNSYSSALADFLHDKFGLQLIFHGKDGKQPYGYTLFDHPGKAIYKGTEIIAIKDLTNNHLPEQVNNIIEETVPAEKQVNSDNIQPENYPNEYYDTPMIDMTNDALIGSEIEIPLLTLEINMADDIDDEAVLGRNRRRKRKARTNTR
ncbi:MAG: relaxase/mobilization nuclease domain-containing protein [Sphingobacterium sp.]|jgi:hypothetical protein|nr:relaxase/mobilization nuclease domain-containing protein [Sphingobacterium sp.]